MFNEHYSYYNIIYIKYVNEIDKNINLNKISFHIF